MKQPLAMAHGRVLTFGLGLGYFAYMCSQKSNVTQVTVVERDKQVIQLFQKHVLPQFSFADKVKIVNDDAYNYLGTNTEQHDFAFVDIYHDASDGLEVYRRFKAQEQNFPHTTFCYWIEKTLKYYNYEI